MCIHRGTSYLGGWQHQRVLGLVFAVWLCASSLLLIPSPAAAVGIDSLTSGLSNRSIRESDKDGGIRASSTITYSSFFPLVSTALSCLPIAGATYGSIVAKPPPVSVPPPINPEYNLTLRGYDPTNESLDLVDIGGTTDSKAPKLYSLFPDNRPANFRTVYKVHKWNYDCGCASQYYEDDFYRVTLGGLAATPGEFILVPSSSYDIGLMTSGYEVMVLYATNTQLTFRYGNEDDIRGDLAGYTIHLENICVDPNLLATYNFWDRQGRWRLPALFAGQPVGRAIGYEVDVVIRDSGMFMDPRSRKDWWK